MSVDQIKNIESLIDLEPGSTIISHEVGNLTAPGENYGSLMLSVNLKVKTKNGTTKIYTVAKMVPPNELMQQIFNTQVTFRNEIAFYRRIIPTLQKFQRERGINKFINFAPKSHGGRLNLTGDLLKVDNDAALVLENLKVKNFTTLERTAGLDLDATKLVLKNLAHLHAVPLALKITETQLFEGEIKPYLETWYPRKDLLEQTKKDVSKIIDEIPELKNLRERILTGISRILDKHESREPFATIAHNDCWTNNNMFKLDDSKPVESILVDFQICNHGSPARDLVFFLFSSVRNNIIKEKYDDLLQDYHQIFVSVLEELRCDPTPFSFEVLKKEIDFEAKYSQFGHVVFMLAPIYMSHDQTRDISELSMETFAEMEVSEEHRQKFIFVVEEFEKRNWI